ncbi:radical SAM protein [bacterium]|nr:radical SAM protein [bacterium]
MKQGKIKVGATQINNGFSGQFYLPYSIGLLYAFVLHNSADPKKFDFNSIIYKRKLLDECFDHLKDRDVILFSIYVWNEKISLAIAKKLKEYDKNKFIIFGGPSVPDNKFGKAEQYIRENSFIDILTHQEGERSILKLLDEYPNNKLEDTPNISFLDKNKNYKNTPNLPRLKDFDKVPSPYLTGMFDNLIKENPEERWLASWETNRGCPFSCTYCDWGSATNSKVSRMHLDRVYDELDWFSKNKVEFIFCCDANFGMLPRDYDIALKAADNKKKYGYPHVLSVQNTKNARERAYKVQKLLADTGLSKGVTLAMQSVDPHTLKAIKRDNISTKDYEELQKRFTNDGIATYTEFILALPGDTYDSFAEGVSSVIQSGQHNRIQFNNLSILPNAEMAEPDNMKKDQIETVSGPIVNVHGSLDETPEDSIYESQQLVISTRTLPYNDWKKTRVYASIAEFLYFNKIAQIPFMVLNNLEKIRFRDLFEHFNSHGHNFKVLKEINKNFDNHAEQISKGKSEFLYKEGYLDIYWPPGEFEYIKLVLNKKLDLFYEELKNHFLIFCKSDFSRKIFIESLELNKKMMRLPWSQKDETFDLNFNIIENYHKILKLNKPNFISKKNKVTIIKSDMKFKNTEEWMREVIWYGHRSGKYLCNIKDLSTKAESHDKKMSLNLDQPHLQ